jgi:Uma2 family endonuclease
MSLKTVLTAEDLFRKGDIGPCELVMGELIRLSLSGAAHGKLVAQIGALLDACIRPRRLGVVCGAETGFILERDPDTVRGPDASFVSRDRIPPDGEPEGYWPFAPDLAVEAISPNDLYREIEQKVEDYLRAGVRLVWIVNPDSQTITVYRPPSEAHILRIGDTLTGADVIPGFEVSVSEVFE